MSRHNKNTKNRHTAQHRPLANFNRFPEPEVEIVIRKEDTVSIPRDEYKHLIRCEQICELAEAITSSTSSYNLSERLEPLFGLTKDKKGEVK